MIVPEGRLRAKYPQSYLTLSAVPSRNRVRSDPFGHAPEGLPGSLPEVVGAPRRRTSRPRAGSPHTSGTADASRYWLTPEDAEAAGIIEDLLTRADAGDGSALEDLLTYLLTHDDA